MVSTIIRNPVTMLVLIDTPGGFGLYSINKDADIKQLTTDNIKDLFLTFLLLSYFSTSS